MRASINCRKVANLVVFSVILLPGATVVADEKEPLKQTRDWLTIPSEKLPDGVVLMKVNDPPEGSPFRESPLATRDQAVLTFLGKMMGVSPKQMREDVDHAGIAIYHDRKPSDEIGIYVLCFREPKVIDTIWKEKEADFAKAGYFRQGRRMVFVWKDPSAREEAKSEIAKYLRNHPDPLSND